MKRLLLIIGTITSMALSMERPEPDYFGRIPNDILGIILDFVTHQNSPDTKFENLKDMFIYQRVNKRWRHIINIKEKLPLILAQEKEIVDACYTDDFNNYNIAKRIYGLVRSHKLDADKESLIYDKKLGCALQRNALVWLFNFCKQDKDNIIARQLYHINLDDNFAIYPITWTVYTDASASRQLIKFFYKNNNAVQEQLKNALEMKEAFDKHQPNKPVTNRSFYGIIFQSTDLINADLPHLTQDELE